jgi:hypothetical protein
MIDVQIIVQDIRQRLIDLGENPDEDGGVFSALISAPYAHPVWRDYWLYACHLRPIIRGGQPLETKYYLEGATHEMWVYALDPDLTLMQHNERPMPAVLSPINHAAQLIRPSDEAVVEEMRKLAHEIANGTMNPDTDNARAWQQRFGTNMVKESYRLV